MKPRVAVVKAINDPEAAARKAVNLLGGIDKFIDPGETVLLKPNLFTTRSSETGATTDLRIVLSIARLLQERNSHCIVGECPAMASYARPDIVFDKLGVNKICEENNIEVRVLDRDHPIKISMNGVVLDDIWFPETCMLYPVISFPKLKTHALTTLTAAVKNLFGLQQGGSKAHHHVRVKNDAEAFSHLLIDIYNAIKNHVKLHIVDAVVAMEGEGPTSGDPIELGLIIAGDDAVAVDFVASSLMDWDPMDVGTNYLAAKRGLGPNCIDDVEIVGESLNGVKKRFKKPQIHSDNEQFFKIRMPLVCDADKCLECGICAKICPVGAIKMKGVPRINDNNCIQCFCCTELCPHGSLKAVRPPDED
jgi:uncharacterized protein (DUF362 family)